MLKNDIYNVNQVAREETSALENWTHRILKQNLKKWYVTLVKSPPGR